MSTVGAVFLPQLPPERLIEVAVAADEAGLAELWLWEDCFRQSGIASAAAALAATRTVRVGIGLLPVPLRNVAITAMELATLERMFPGRPVAGVGHGVQDWMAQVGARAASPLTLLREHLGALRALLDGDEVSTEGRYVRLDRVRLDWPPAGRVALHAGATGPRTLALAGELADGTILTGGTTPDQVRAARRRIGAAGPHRVTVYVHAATGPDAAERLAGDLRRWGNPPESGVAGDADAVADGVRRYVAAGADAVILQPTPDDPDPAGFVRFAGAEVAPRVPAG
ncbi:MAG TPA: LLM class flavin-dependent oxidoreductase [Pseudonocardiaceae bacterium]